MYDSKTLAQHLGVTAKTINARARALGLTATKATQGDGGPRNIWTEEQAQQIANYGDSRSSSSQAQQASQQFAHAAEQGGQLAVHQVQGQLASSLQGQLGQVDAQCSAIEEQAGMAIAARISAVPSRAMGIAAQQLQTQGLGLDMASFGNFQIQPAAAPTPAFLDWAKDNSGISDGPEAA